MTKSFGSDHPSQPRETDALLGGEAPVPVNCVVLGGIEGVKRRLASSDPQQRIAALREALEYGQYGLELVMHGLKDESWSVQFAAYSLLQEHTEPALKQALQQYLPKYLPLKCVRTLTFANESFHSCEGALWYEGPIRNMTISPDKRLLFGIRYGEEDDPYRPEHLRPSKMMTLRVIDLQTGGVLYRKGSDDPKDYLCAFSLDGQILAVVSWRAEIQLWDLSSGTCRSTLRGHSNWVVSLAISPDGQTLASGSCDKTIKLWDLDSGTLKTTLSGHSDSVYSLAISPDGQTLASGSRDKTIKLWDLDSGEVKTTLSGHSNTVLSLAISPDAQTLASGSCDKTIKLWDLDSGKLKTTLTGHSEWVTSLAMTPDSQSLASGSKDTIMFWNLGGSQLLHTINKRGIFSQDCQTIAITTEQGEIEVWQTDQTTQLGLDPVELFHRYLALKEALSSNQEGLDLVIQALRDQSPQIQQIAECLLLSKCAEARVKEALLEYNPSSLNL